MKIYVVAWEFEWGGGFNWYPKRSDAKKAFEDEKKNEKRFKKDKWKAYYKEFDISYFEDAITEELDSILCNELKGEQDNAKVISAL